MDVELPIVHGYGLVLVKGTEWQSVRILVE